MKKYERPDAVVIHSVNEGVYAVSGKADCWKWTGKSVQDWNGSHNVFEMEGTHFDTVQHIYDSVTVTYTFNSPIVDAYSENDWQVEVSGNTVTVKRVNHGNGYNSGDHVTYKVWVKAADEATTKALALTDLAWACGKQVNVQGGGADGN
ncbi:MAG: hypothetical protein IJ733_18885 [Lachnospiraceae bacterium]|nr:hypothetical protein [Lachnospiraceae bacterium]